MITLNKKGNPVLETEASIVYEVAAGPAWTRFFEGIRQEKILGTRCEKCQKVLVPARSYCSKCFDDKMQWVQVADEGELMGWSMTKYSYFGMPTEPPFITGLIQLDGADSHLAHLVGGFDLNNMDLVTEKVKIGSRVKAVWADKKEGTVMDIRYFVPI